MHKNQVATAKVALVTGAARRIGAEIATILHENGMNIALHYHHSQQEALQLCALLNEHRAASAICLKANLADVTDINSLINQSINQWGRLDALINNASCFYKTNLSELTETAWNTLMDTNLKAPFFLAKEAAPHLAKERGCIVSIIDIHAKRPMYEYPVYSISKAGLRMLTQSLARELGPAVRVNAVSPGAIIWPEGENTFDSELKQKIIEHTALKCHGHPREIAKAVLFLVKDADYITGQDIAVDGGRLLYID